MDLSLGQSTQSKVAYLRTLPSIRERCNRVFSLAQQDKLEYFTYNPDAEKEPVAFCAEIIQRDFGSDLKSIPPHGRWRHLDAGRSRIEPMVSSWKALPHPPDEEEICKRLIDLFLVSVLLDAGAGNVWSYSEPGTDESYRRSEGLGVASFHMFINGLFSGDSQQLCRVDASGLSKLTTETVASSMQVTPTNPMAGIDGRASLLFNLAKALQANSIYFGEGGRPGNVIDFLKSESTFEGSVRHINVGALWHALIDGLTPIWPSSRTKLGDIPLGDVWPCSVLRSSSSLQSTADGDDLVPFHKLTGWITYSLMEPLQKVLGWKFDGIEDMVGLPEYRNGGLFVDFGVLTLRPGVLNDSFYSDKNSGIPKLPPSHPAIIEWRAMTVILLDRTADAIRFKFGLTPEQLTLAQVLESATWKGGREIAQKKRPQTGGPPIEIESDGTVF